MKEEDKAYIASIIDGKVSIMLEKIHKNQHPSPVISVTSTTQELLKYLKSTLGSGTITKKTNYTKEKLKDCYTFVICYYSAIKLLTGIYPYLIIKTKKYELK